MLPPTKLWHENRDGSDTPNFTTKPTTGYATPPAGINTYDEYGNQTNNTQTIGTNQNYGSAGSANRNTNKNGLVLLGARAYNPTTGQFTTTDPVRGGNENAYNYPNNPVNQNDFSGCDSNSNSNWDKIFQYSKAGNYWLPGARLVRTKIGWFMLRVCEKSTVIGGWKETLEFIPKDRNLNRLNIKNSEKYSVEELWAINLKWLNKTIRACKPVVSTDNPLKLDSRIDRATHEPTFFWSRGGPARKGWLYI